MCTQAHAKRRDQETANRRVWHGLDDRRGRAQESVKCRGWIDVFSRGTALLPSSFAYCTSSGSSPILVLLSSLPSWPHLLSPTEHRQVRGQFDREGRGESMQSAVIYVIREWQRGKNMAEKYCQWGTGGKFVFLSITTSVSRAVFSMRQTAARVFLPNVGCSM